LPPIIYADGFSAILISFAIFAATIFFSPDFHFHAFFSADDDTMIMRRFRHQQPPEFSAFSPPIAVYTLLFTLTADDASFSLLFV
jgi:hypothetical protein